MIKLFLSAIVVVGSLILWLWRRYGSEFAEKRKLLRKIRTLENEMANVKPGSTAYSRLRAKWMSANRRYADISKRK